VVANPPAAAGLATLERFLPVMGNTLIVGTMISAALAGA
jgi:hypothetical protein